MNTDCNAQQEYEYMVCVHCMTFNQEKYIRKCLDGFVMQKTSFPFVVVVVDDDSMDKTPAIISEYAMRYPSIIHPVLLEENHYSIRKSKAPYFEPYDKKAKYVAFCEGDDYWTDSNKLQRQVDVLEKYPNCKACFHKVSKVDERGNDLNATFPSMSIKQGYIKPTKFIKMLRDDFTFHLTSQFLNSKEYIKYITMDFQFRKVARCGDIPLLLYFGQYGVFYIDEVMSCYRVGSVGSHTEKMLHDREYRNLFYDSIDNMMDEYDNFTSRKYHKYCTQIKQRYHFIKLQLSHHLGNISTEQYEKEIIKREYRYHFKTNTPFKSRLLTYLNVYLPRVGKLVKKYFVNSK